MNNTSQINYIVSKVFEKADEYNIDVEPIRTGRRNIIFNFRKNGKRLDIEVDEYSIYTIRNIDVIVNNILEKMEELK